MEDGRKFEEGHGNFKSYLVRIGKLPIEDMNCKCGEEEDDAEHA